MHTLAQFEVLSFDCYGTLIDWESGILQAVRPLLKRRGITASREDILAAYSELESGVQRGPYRRYRDVLRMVVDGYGERFGFQPTREERDVIVESLPSWQAFPDTVNALRRLSAHYRLAIVSNIDDDLFDQTRKRHLKVPFAAVVTAEQAGVYKPAHAIFRRARAAFAVPTERWLHAGESTYHDVAPANELGIASVHVNRRGDPSATGASRAVPVQADYVVSDLHAFADLVDRQSVQT